MNSLSQQKEKPDKYEVSGQPPSECKVQRTADHSWAGLSLISESATTELANHI